MPSWICPNLGEFEWLYPCDHCNRYNERPDIYMNPEEMSCWVCVEKWTGIYYRTSPWWPVRFHFNHVTTDLSEMIRKRFIKFVNWSTYGRARHETHIQELRYIDFFNRTEPTFQDEIDRVTWDDSGIGI